MSAMASTNARSELCNVRSFEALVVSVIPLALLANRQGSPRKVPDFLPRDSPSYEGLRVDAAALAGVRSGSKIGIRCGLSVKKPPSLRNNNGSLQVRVRMMDGLPSSTVLNVGVPLLRLLRRRRSVPRSGVTSVGEL